MQILKLATDRRKDKTVRLAGGGVMAAAVQDAESLLRRTVMANLLWENQFYQDGKTTSDLIGELIPKVHPEVCFQMAIEARTKQNLRHVPLLIAREMARHDSHKKLVGDLLPQIILRADEIIEFMAIYWKDGKIPLSKQVRKGLGLSFDNFDEYQFAKYNRKTEIKFRDVLFLTHPKPKKEKEELYRKIADNNLSTPDTWEVALSTGEDKKSAWERLIQSNKLGALAFIRNLRNMEDVEVPKKTILEGFQTINPRWLLPLNFIAAAKQSPRFERELEVLMMKGLELPPKLTGHSILIVDVSGSMSYGNISTHNSNTRLDAAASLAMLASEMCENISIYATAGTYYEHKTEIIRPRRGFALIEEINKAARQLGGGGIFTRQCIDYIRTKEEGTPERIIIFSDSQDCDNPSSGLPKPFGKNNYIIDISAYKHGINYKGIWTAEISGWSEHFLSYIAAYEGLGLEVASLESGN